MALVALGQPAYMALTHSRRCVRSTAPELTYSAVTGMPRSGSG
ncbi:MAG: hypothetical protein V7640_3890 [Betaproteobacteria bacterium]